MAIDDDLPTALAALAEQFASAPRRTAPEVIAAARPLHPALEALIESMVGE